VVVVTSDGTPERSPSEHLIAVGPGGQDLWSFPQNGDRLAGGFGRGIGVLENHKETGDYGIVVGCPNEERPVRLSNTDCGVAVILSAVDGSVVDRRPATEGMDVGNGLFGSALCVGGDCDGDGNRDVYVYSSGFLARRLTCLSSATGKVVFSVDVPQL